MGLVSTIQKLTQKEGFKWVLWFGYGKKNMSWIIAARFVVKSKLVLHFNVISVKELTFLREQNICITSSLGIITNLYIIHFNLLTLRI